MNTPGWVRAHTALAAFALGASWNLPLTGVSAMLGWLGAFALCRAVLQGACYRDLYEAGVISQLLGFHWLLSTIATFAGLPYSVSVVLFGLFVAISALQFPLFLWVYRNLPRVHHRVQIALPLAWVATELLSVRIFPWFWGHTQLEFSALAQLAEFGGAPLISFLLFYCCGSLAHAITSQSWRAVRVAGALLVAGVSWGTWRLQTFEVAPRLSVVLGQGNISLEEKGDGERLMENLERYSRITQTAISPETALVVWPETVFQAFLSERVSERIQDNRLEPLPQGVPLLFGALTFRSPEDTANSALLLQADGSLEPPYRKQVLMPFGEYTPFGTIFPLLKELNFTAPNFVAGTGPVVFHVPQGLSVSPLICYEDLVPDLAVDSVRGGATVLANITNDAWFGNTIAPYQHHLIAAFRAIETRRYLLRATNTGFTAVVDPLGRTVSGLVPFTEGALTVKISPGSEVTPFVALGGERPWRFAAWFVVILAILPWFRSKLGQKQERPVGR